MCTGCVQAGPLGAFVLWDVILGLGTGMTALALGATIANPCTFERKGLVIGLLAGSSATGQLVVLPLATLLIESMFGALRRRHPAATAVRADLVVVGSPARDLDAGQRQV